MNVLHIKQLLYYQRYSFSGLELHASYDQWATAVNTHHSLFSIHHFSCALSITWKPWHACSSDTHQMTPLLPWMFLFMSKASKQLQPMSYSPVRTSLSHHLVCMYIVFSWLDVVATLLSSCIEEWLQFESVIYVFQLVSSYGDMDVWVQDYWWILDSKTWYAHDPCYGNQVITWPLIESDYYLNAVSNREISYLHFN